MSSAFSRSLLCVRAQEYARGLKKLVLKLQVPDVPRVNEIPTPPAAAAQVAQAVVAAAAGGSASSGTSLGSTLAASGQLSTAASPSKDGASSTSTGSSVPPSPSAPAVVDPRSFDRFMMAFRNLHMTLATNFEILSAKIVEQVYKPLSVHREAHASASKRLLADLDKYTVSYQRHLDGLLQSRAACQKACQESDAMRRKLEHASTHASATTNPHALNDLLASFKADSASLAKRALQADAKYIQHVKSMRGFRQSSDATLAHVLDQFESLEVSKLGTCKETLGHYLAIQNQMFASNLKNLTAVQSVLDKVNVHTDMQYFILLNKSGKLPIALPEYQVFRGHPNYTMPGAAGGEESEGGHQLDMSSYSSAQMGEGMNDSPSDLVGAGIGAGAGGIGGGINSGFAASGGVTSVPGTAGGLLASAKSASSKGSGWGWLNSIASVLPGTQQNKTHRGLGIDHDSEAMLTRGSNYYEQKAAAAAAAATGTDDADDPDSSPPASRRGTTSASGGDEGDDAEEKTPERLAAEKQLSEYFDAITGRAPSGSTPTSSASGSGAPSKSLSPSLSGAHESVTYSTSRERDLTPEELARTDALLATVEGRKAFASVLNRQRNTSGGLRLSSSSSLHRLAEWCRRFLDAAQQSMHVNPTQLVMIMSQSFYVEELAPPASASASSSDSSFAGASDATDEDSHAASARLTRIYLISLIKDHALWKQLRFWEEAFFDAFNTKIRKSAAAKVHKCKWEKRTCNVQRQDEARGCEVRERECSRWGCCDALAQGTLTWSKPSLSTLASKFVSPLSQPSPTTSWISGCRCAR